MNRAVPALLLLVLLGACVKRDPYPRFTPAWGPFDPEGWTTTRQALLCADCQLQNLYNMPLPERNLSAETVAATAIRPPQLDLFSPDVLGWILENGAPDKDVVIHLGDAMNLATRGELDKFLDVMARSDKPWFMAPGNHDVFYFGVYATEDPQLLKDAAFRSGVSLHKSSFIRLYVAAILRQDDAGCAGLAQALGINPKADATLDEVAAKIPLAFEWKAPDESTGILDRICWNIDEESDWQSYILQSLDLSKPGVDRPTRILLMDSCQYARPPEMAPNAWRSFPVSLNCGLSGEMLADQLRKIREWLEANRKAGGGALMCHHPFETLTPRAKTNLGYLWREYKIGMMVSAHTHSGYYAHHDLGGDNDFLELNIGSTTDWPMEWRTLQGFWKPDEKRVYIRSKRSTLAAALQQRGGFFEPEWEIDIDAPDDYRSYKQGQPAKSLLVGNYLAYHYQPYFLPRPKVKVNQAAEDTEEQVKDSMLWAYARILNLFPTAPGEGVKWPKGSSDDKGVQELMRKAYFDGSFVDKVDLLVDLEAFERTRGSVDPETGKSNDARRTRYKISQAAWASRFMKARGRKLNVEDELIQVEGEKWMGVPAATR